MSEFIDLQDIHKTYHIGEVDLHVLNGVSLRIAKGELVAESALAAAEAQTPASETNARHPSMR